MNNCHYKNLYHVTMLACVLCHLFQEWTSLERPKGAPWPVGRSSHAACCLNFGEEHPQLLVTGGVDNNGNSLQDAWVLDVKSGRWREVRIYQWFNCLSLQCAGHFGSNSLRFLFMLHMLIIFSTTVQMITKPDINNYVTQFLPFLQLTLHEAAQTWLRHTATALSLGPGWTEVIMFGGCPKWKWGKLNDAQQKLAQTTVMEFSEQKTFFFPF